MSRYSAPLVGRAQGARRAQRVQLRPPQGFVGVDVAHPGDERLVDEERLEARAAARGCAGGTRAGVNRGSRGSGPTPSNGSSSAPYSPTRPNLRMSRKRSSRPSSSDSASRSYGSRGSDAGTTNSWPVILRWTVRKAPPERSTISCLPRRPIASTRRPATPAANRAGSSSRSVRCQLTRAPVIAGPAPPSDGRRRRRRSRATVSTSGSSGIVETIGQAPLARRGNSGTIGGR